MLPEFVQGHRKLSRPKKPIIIYPWGGGESEDFGCVTTKFT